MKFSVSICAQHILCVQLCGVRQLVNIFIYLLFAGWELIAAV